ncbi:MAG: DoxX family membrane protein [Candidatus Dadabacteria bacterium]|nr:MAG: DoxX family membrane protein [Candidatus Dadabacteria bacterium]
MAEPRSVVVGRWLAAGLFVTVGILHFVRTASFEAIMPPWIPAHRLCVLISGVAEISGGIGLLLPRWRRSAGWGLLALLVAVWPANIHMAINDVQVPGLPPAPGWALWLRALAQPLLMLWVWVVARDGGSVARQ